MTSYTKTIESSIIMNGNKDYKTQIENLEKSFIDFYLVSFKKELRKDIGVSYHIFKFTHTVSIKNDIE
jgi:hypothetical protein